MWLRNWTTCCVHPAPFFPDAAVLRPHLWQLRTSSPAPGSREGKVLPAWQWREDRYADITTRAQDHSTSSEGLEGDKVRVLEELGRKGLDGFLV